MKDTLEGTGFTPRFMKKSTGGTGSEMANVPDDRIKIDALKVIRENEVKMEKIYKDVQWNTCMRFHVNIN